MRSYSKVNRAKIRDHILEYYESVNDLRANREAARHPHDSDQQAAIRLVEGGDFAISYHDQREFIDSLNLSDGKYSDSEVFSKYCYLLAREINNLISAEA